MSCIQGPAQLKILIVLEKISVADYFGHKFPIGNACHTCDRSPMQDPLAEQLQHLHIYDELWIR